MFIFRLLFQTVLIALAQIWTNKVRALLTTLGIVIGVAAVVSIIAATKGMEKFVLDQFATLGANKVWIFPRMPDGRRDKYNWRQIRISTKQVDGMLAASPSLARLSPVMNFTGPVQAGDKVKDLVTITGIRPDWHEIESRYVTVGRPFTRTDEEGKLQVCLINDKGVAELNLNADPTGTVILVAGRRFKIVGVVETKAVSPMFGGDEAQTEIYIPFATGEMMRPEPRMYVIAQSRGPELSEDVKAEVSMYMRRVRQIQPGDPNTFGVEAIDSAIEQFKKIATFLQIFAAGIVAISLVVGGIGIMNIMLVSVSERTREIGLRKAVGAKPSVILTQFLVEAVTLCLIGGAIGLGIGQGLVFILRAVPQLSLDGAVIPGWAIGLSVGFCAATGLVFGMFPAIKASRLDPIEALRHE
ncbi:MAG: ABC transporter permease [Phycisphaeraceae bacterium]|nr:ABC transporter permease [Phycisphaeraceae bacterium]